MSEATHTADVAPVMTLVVVGASAGGIEALSTLLAALPANFPAAVVIAQHLDPRRPSHLGDILARRSALPVRTVTDHEPLRAGMAFVAPADRDVTIADHALNLNPSTYGHPKPSVDVLFRSAAYAFGENSIAVILSGTGSDGADGARQIKEAGGTVLIQDPATASYPGMPASLAPTTVDIVAPLERIGPLLVDLLRVGSLTAVATEDRTLRALLEHVREQSGVDFSSYKTPTILRRLQRRVVATGSTGIADYIRYLQARPEEYDKLISSFLIKMTRFFRDPDVFAYLREGVLPELIAALPPREAELRLWSAGCATGEEAYTLAILVAEALGDALDTTRIRIFATELDAEAVAFARRGIYPASAVGDVPPAILGRYFIEQDGSYEITKRIRSLVVFGEHDLSQRAPFPHIDLCLCRNVLIYFTPELQRRALQLFTFALREGGYLLLGRAETTSPLPEFFKCVEPRLKVYRRYGERIMLPPASIKGTTPLSAPVPLSRIRALVGGPDEAARVERGSERLGHVLRASPLGVVSVDRRYDIGVINGAARRFLGIHGMAVGEDLLHLVPSAVATRLRPLIDAALDGDAPAPVVLPLAGETADDAATYVQIICYRAEATEGAAAHERRGPEEAVLLLTEVTALVGERQALERDAADARARGRQLEEQLNAERTQATDDRDRLRRLLRANDELAAVNEALRDENESLLTSNEEAQASTEEVETLNEELQATNEELQTLNEELQATVEELNTTNDDLQMRNLEMRDLADRLEEQGRAREERRTQLAALLLAREDAVLVVDDVGAPVLSNAAYARMASGVDAQFAPDNPQGQPLPATALPQWRAAHGETFTMEVTHVGSDNVRRRYEVTGQPLGGDDAPRGGVLVIRAVGEA